MLLKTLCFIAELRIHSVCKGISARDDGYTYGLDNIKKMDVPAVIHYISSIDRIINRNVCSQIKSPLFNEPKYSLIHSHIHDLIGRSRRSEVILLFLLYEKLLGRCSSFSKTGDIARCLLKKILSGHISLPSEYYTRCLSRLLPYCRHSPVLHQYINDTMFTQISHLSYEELKQLLYFCDTLTQYPPIIVPTIIQRIQDNLYTIQHNKLSQLIYILCLLKDPLDNLMTSLHYLLQYDYKQFTSQFLMCIWSTLLNLNQINTSTQYTLYHYIIPNHSCNKPSMYFKNLLLTYTKQQDPDMFFVNSLINIIEHSTPMTLSLQITLAFCYCSFLIVDKKEQLLSLLTSIITFSSIPRSLIPMLREVIESAENEFNIPSLIPHSILQLQLNQHENKQHSQFTYRELQKWQHILSQFTHFTAYKSNNHIGLFKPSFVNISTKHIIDINTIEDHGPFIRQRYYKRLGYRVFNLSNSDIGTKRHNEDTMINLQHRLREEFHQVLHQ